MNILVSYNWIKEYLKTDLSSEEFARRTTAAGNSVERMENLSARFENMVVGVVKTVKAHPNANKLRIAETDIGHMVEIVCGGLNLAEGQLVAVALPGSRVRWHGDEAYTTLVETEIRGVKSFGMICAAVELGFDKLPQGDHDIWDLTNIVDAKAGTPLAKALGLDDVIFDIEVTTNRPDCMSIVGQARDGGAATGDTFAWESAKSPKGSAKVDLSAKVQDKELCLKYQAVVMDGVKVGPSPWWLQARLLLAGHRPINNVVDVTNYVLHELGQPMHTFDAATLAGEEIIVRRAKAGEKIVALDGKTYELKDSMLVIADAGKPIAIAGVMGGMETGTTEKTTRIILESATFDPVSVRQTSRALNLTSDSSLLFEKGLSTEATSAALARACELIAEVAGGSVVSHVVTEESEKYKPLHFGFDPERTNALLGIEIPTGDMTDMLERLGFELKKTGKTFDVEVPYWRDNDIEDSRDFVEEVARLYGYANIPSKLPAGELPKATPNNSLVWERRAKEFLRGAGLTEAYSYSFVSAAQLTMFGTPVTNAIKIKNPLSSDQDYLRTSLIPSLLTVVEANQKRSPEGSIFEISPVYIPQPKGLPKEPMRLSVAIWGADGAKCFAHAKGTLERFLRELGLDAWTFERGSKESVWHSSRSASVSVGGQMIGTIGQIADSVAKPFGIDGAVVCVDLDADTLFKLAKTGRTFHPLPLYPAVKRDVAVIVDDTLEFGAIEQKLTEVSPLLREIELFDVYRGKGVPEGKKSLAMHLAFRSDEGTLSAEEADAGLASVRDVLQKTFGGIMRS